MPSNEAHYSRADIPRAERAIRLGTLLYTMVEARAGFELAYNRWYERDHFYSGCMIGEAILSGARYIATADCKALRYGTAGDLALGTFLALYWILDEHHARWGEFGVEQVNRLHEQGRMFQERDHILTGFYTYQREFNAPGSTMPIELALDRRYGGVAAFIIDLADGRTAADADAFFTSIECPGDVALLCMPFPIDPRSPADVPRSAGNHVNFIAFTVEDPAEVWAERFAGLGQRVTDAGLGTVRLASPFRSSVFGTDTYIDEL